jgi:outer membrane murein-binding lipoprotein Lpp
MTVKRQLFWEQTHMKKTVATLIGIISAALLLAGHAETLYAAAAQTPAEQLYAELAKLKPDQRAKRLEEGARKEGKLTFVHTWRGKIARDFGTAFEKRIPTKNEMSDWVHRMPRNASLRKSDGRHLTDILSLAVPDLAVV